MPAKIKIRINYRRVDTGVYVTEEYAKKHPHSTVKETDRVPSTKKPPKKKNK